MRYNPVEKTFFDCGYFILNIFNGTSTKKVNILTALKLTF